MQAVKLFIGIISNRNWQPRFGLSLAYLASYLTQHGTGHADYKLESFVIGFLGQASCLSMAQEKLADQICTGDFTHFLFLDDDMTFPTDIVGRLIVHDKDFVGVNYRHKTPELVKGVCDDMSGDMLDSTGKTGLQEVFHMGGAGFLMKADALRRIPKPRFAVPYIKEREDYMGSDVFFAMVCRNAGIQMWVDHDLSQQIGHIGDFEYRFPQVAVKPNLALVSNG